MGVLITRKDYDETDAKIFDALASWTRRDPIERARLSDLNAYFAPFGHG
jgi:hypothetical protein